jgi:ABC-type bacteriocin/lantibiotic exporter with double-glycine peptidase domain
MKNFIHIVFEKYGMIKLFGSAILSALLYTLYYYTGLIIIKYIMIPFVIYLILTTIVLFTYAWIINPILNRREKNQTK